MLQQSSDEEESIDNSSDDLSEESTDEESEYNLSNIPQLLLTCEQAYEEKDFWLCLEYSNIILELDENNVNALKINSKIYYEMKKYDRALINLNKILNLIPDDTQTLRERGFVYWKTKEYAIALNDFNVVIESSLNDMDVLDLLEARSQIFMILKDSEKAFMDLNRILIYKSMNKQALLSRALICEEKKKVFLALADLDLLVSLTNVPQEINRNALMCRARIYFGLNQLQNALDNLNPLLGMERVFLQDHIKKSALLMRMKVHRKNNDLVSALKDADRYITNFKDLESLLFRSEIHFLQDNPNKAINDLTQALAINHNHYEALTRRAEIHKKYCNEKQAILDEKRAIKLALSQGGNGVPTLSQFCKMAFLNSEPRIYASGKIFNIDANVARHALSVNGINRISLAAIQEVKNKCLDFNGRTVFDQLDSIQSNLCTNYVVNELANKSGDSYSTELMLIRTATKKRKNIHSSTSQEQDEPGVKKQKSEITIDQLRARRLLFYTKPIQQLLVNACGSESSGETMTEATISDGIMAKHKWRNNNG